jgi:tetratricopeptide (TPR) repeat protein
MTPERWARVTEIFGEVLDLPLDAQRAHVERVCGDDAALRDEILALLDSDARSAFLDKPVVGADRVREVAMEDGKPRTFTDGDVIAGRFRIRNFLGEGGMGEVYAAEDRALGSMVAIKTLHRQLASTNEFAERFRREVKIARQVTHSNVCRLFDAGEHEGTLFFSMELLEGETLSRRLERDGKFDAKEALGIVRQICAGLAAAHAAGVVHRDFKSANVMLVGDRAVITDFGLSRAFVPSDRRDRGTTSISSGIAIGTPAYMAPEQIEGASAGPTADIYALGVVMYEMLTAHRPYEEASPLAMAVRKMKGPPKPPGEFANVSGRWESVILRCLAVSPKARFQTAQEVVEGLEGGRVVRLPALSAAHVGKLAVLVAVLAGAGWWGMRTWLRSAQHQPPAAAVRWYLDGERAIAENAWYKASRLFEQAVQVDAGYRNAHARLAEVYAELDQLDRSKDSMLKAVSLAPDRSSLSRSDALLLNAAQAMVERDFDKAEADYRQLTELDATNAGRAWMDVGRAANKGLHTAASLEAYDRALEKGGEREAALLNQGNLLLRDQKGDAALAKLNEAEGLFKLASNPEGVAETLMARGRVYERSRDLMGAEREMRAALDVARQSATSHSVVKAQLEVGRLVLLQGRVAEAHAIIDAGLRGAEAEHLESLTVSALNDLGGVWASKSDWKSAEPYFTRALEFARRGHNLQGEARANAMLAQAYAASNRFAEALESAQRAVNFYRNGFLRNYQAAMTVLMDVQNKTGQYAQVLESARALQAQGVAQKSPEPLQNGLEREAIALILTGQYPLALQQSVKFTEGAKASGQAQQNFFGLIHQIDALFRMGRFDDALTLVAEARRLEPTNSGYVDGTILDLYLMRRDSKAGDLAQAAKLAAARLAASDPNRVTDGQRILCVLGMRAKPGAASHAACQKALQNTEGKPPYYGSLARLAVAESALRAKLREAPALTREALEYAKKFGLADDALHAQLLLEYADASAPQTFEREVVDFTKDWTPEDQASYLNRPDIREWRKK